MQKIWYVIIIAAATLSLAAASFAEHQEIEPNPEIASLIILKNDYVKPEHSKGFISETVSPYFQYHGWLGVGGDFTSQPGNKNYLEAKPYLTVNSGPYYALLGYSTNSAGNDYVQAGAWYLNRFGKIAVFADVRNYFAVDGKSSDYLDAFGEATYDLSRKVAAGVNAEYMHWWKGAEHNLYFIGPVVYYKLTKVTTIYGRVSREWNVIGSANEPTNRFRLGLKFSY